MRLDATILAAGLEVDRMFVGTVLIGFIGVAAPSLLRELERLAIPWSR